MKAERWGMCFKLQHLGVLTCQNIVKILNYDKNDVLEL